MTGYHYGEQPVAIGDWCDTLALKRRGRRQRVDEVEVVGTWPTGVGIVDGTMKPWIPPFVPAKKDMHSHIASAMKRYGVRMPEQDAGEIAVFEQYCKGFIETYFKPPVSMPTFEEWLEHSKYPGWRREELREVARRTNYARPGNKREDWFYAQSFIKDESYPEPKIARTINALSDEIKCIYGPAFHAIDKATYATLGGKWFIKGTNPRELPKRMAALFGDRPVVETDFSSFESHHRGAFNRIVRHWMMHMVRGFPRCGRQWKKTLSRIVHGTNTCRYSTIEVTLDETLMSGASWTSSSNGVMNLLIMSYIWARSSRPDLGVRELIELAKEFPGLVEGDDGISVDTGFDEAIVKKLGLKLKFERHARFGEANFCGVVMGEDGEVMTDPKEFIRKFYLLPQSLAHASEKKKMAYLRCKAMSALVQYRNCPVVGPIAQSVMDRTKGYDIRGVIGQFDRYTQDKIRNALAMKKTLASETTHIKDTTRIAMEQRYGLVTRLQREIEEKVLRDGRAVFDHFDMLTRAEVDQRNYHIVKDVAEATIPIRYYVDPRVAAIARQGFLKRRKQRTPSTALMKQLASEGGRWLSTECW